MTESPSGIPHALETAFCNLVAALDDGIRQYQANLQYTNSHDVCRCIERFVDALRHISGGQAELQKRAALVETRCGPGSQYATARAQSLKYRGQPQKLSASQQAISQLRRSSGSPRSLAEVETERRYVEYVLDDPKRKLSPPVREGFAALHNA